ncbi:MAG TPA: thiamine-phosphate kinase [Spirochaetia bacterium]|nr:thiamine-phosphate kinase [Spirochaetia bacterium]
MKIDQLGEFGLIERIRSVLPEPGPNVVVGIGDDVAVVEGSSESVWLATCDVQVEGAHFLRDSIPPKSLGRKALAINLSDIASAGGIPRFALVSLGLPVDLEVSFIDELYAGLREEGEKFGVEIVGGNISKSRLGMFIDVFLMGETLRENVVLRSGAKPGDRIMVTGTVGDAAAGVALLLDHTLKSDDSYAATATERQYSPTPRVKEGALIGALRQANAMIDVSDGLAGDLGHICEKSGVSARLDAARLPVRPENRTLAQAARGDEWHFALHGGEDYELLITARPGRAERLAQRITAETGTPVTVIGEILPPDQPAQLVLPDGKTVPLGETGWDHFKAQT